MTSPRVTSSADQAATPIYFGAYSINPTSGELRKDGLPVHLSRQANQLLLLLLEAPGRIRTREELKRVLWAGESYGDFDHGLNKTVYSLRAALGDLARNPRLIETLSGQGYRFIGAIRVDKEVIRPPRPWSEMPVAIMPFAVGTPELNWISTQIVAQVIDKLSRVPGLKVLAYSQVRSLLPREDMESLQERFGVRAMIVGDLKSDNEELYIHGEMVDGLDGTQMWGFHARMSLRSRDCAARVAEGIVSRVKAARRQDLKAAGLLEPQESSWWGKCGSALVDYWRNFSLRGDVPEAAEGIDPPVTKSGVNLS